MPLTVTSLLRLGACLMVDVLLAAGNLWQTLVRTGSEQTPFRVRIVAPTTTVFTCGNGIPVAPDCSVADDPTAGILILPELWLGPGEHIRGRYPELMEWIRGKHEEGTTLYFACLRAVMLAETGLLEGCEVTSHWGYEDLFRNLLTSIRQRIIEAKATVMERKKRLSMLQSQLRKVGQQGAAENQQIDLRMQIEDLENTLVRSDLRLLTLEGHLGFVLDVLGNPSQFVSATSQHLYLTHMGIKLEQDSNEPGYELVFAEVRIASKAPRVAALVRFPRSELLPKPELLMETDLFLPA